jgi:hypothetical protein
MRSALPFLLVASIVGAGCLGLASDRPAEQAGGTGPGRILLAGTWHGAGEPASWPGRLLTTPTVADEACLPDHCERIPFRLERSSAADPAVLQVALTWSPDGNTGDTDLAFPNFDLRVLTAGGEEVARSPLYKLGAHVLLEGLETGDYVAEVRIRHLNPGYYLPWVMYILGVPIVHPPVPYPNPVTARGTYTGTLLLATPEAPTEGPDLLPDLVVHSMRDLRLSYAPPGHGHGAPPAAVTVGMPLAPGCTDDEYLFEGARRCLRFSVGLGNAGAGPLELGYDHTTTSPHTEEPVPAMQCITTTEGTGWTRPSGNGSYHRIHGHDHQRDILSYDLHAYDEATRTRGEALRAGEKFGYGFYRQGLVDGGAALAWPSDTPSPCGDGFAYWLNPGWYDVYMYWRTGQYIDIAGVPDGAYELVATVNASGDILESDRSNNEARVAFRLAGDEVTVLEPWSYPRAP